MSNRFSTASPDAIFGRSASSKTHIPNRMPKPALILISFIVLSACITSAPAAQEQAAESGAVAGVDASELEPYTLEIEEAMVEVEMLPISPGSIEVETDEGEASIDVGSFWISQTEIPWELFDLYAFSSADDDEGLSDEDAILRPSKPYGAPDRGFGHRGYAAISMSYLVAEEFTRWLSARTGHTYRLPTEAEWEYACRAGREEPLSDAELAEHAWFWDNAFDETHPIGELEPNAFGIHDMLGNAAEWCTGLDGEPIACGGHFLSKAEDVHCGARMTPSRAWQETDPQIPKSEHWLTDAPFMGFRVIRVPEL